MSDAPIEKDGDGRAALACNQAFYQAFAAGDFGAMEDLWSTAEHVICVHPGTAPLHGHALVMETWRQILENPPALVSSDATVEVIRGLAFVTCIENFQLHQLAATNVFVWENGDWRLTLHHAGAIAPAGNMAPPSDQVH
jgi:hypothetical protein